MGIFFEHNRVSQFFGDAKNIATVLSKEKCILKIYKSRNKRQKQLIYVFTSFR